MLDDNEVEEMVFDNIEEMEEFVEGFVEIASTTMDKIIEKDIPMKTAKVMKAYWDAYIIVGFPIDEAYRMVNSTIRSQVFNKN